MAQENKLITAEVVEANEYPQLSRMYGVRAVPKTVLNRIVEFVGAVPEESFLEQVLKVGVKKEAQEQTSMAKKE